MPSIFSCFKDGFNCRKKKKDKVSSSTKETTANATGKDANGGKIDEHNGSIKTTDITFTAKSGNDLNAANKTSPHASPKLNGHAKNRDDTANQAVTDPSDATKSSDTPEEPDVKTSIPDGFKVDQEFLKKFFEYNKSGMTELQLFNKLLDDFSGKGLISITQIVVGPGHQPEHRTTIELMPPERASFVGNSSRKIDSKNKAAKELVDWLKTQDVIVEASTKKLPGANDKNQGKLVEDIKITDIYTAYKSISADSTSSKTELLDKLLEIGKEYLRLETIKKPNGSRVVLINENHTFVASDGMSSKPKELIAKMLFPLLAQGKQQNAKNTTSSVDKLVKLYKAASHPPKEPANLIQALKDKSPQDIKILVHTSGPSHEPIHYTEVVLVAPDIRFKAAAKNKSESKNLATKEAVNYLEAISLVKQPLASVKTQKSFKGADSATSASAAASAANRRKSTDGESGLISPKTAQSIVDAVQKRWKEVAASLSADIVDYESLAAFVAVSSRDHSAQVLSIGTNGSWALAETTATTGKVVHDSHAVVIARRALLCLLYENLLKLLENQNRDKPEFVLQKAGKAYRLKTHLKLYLYSSTTPVGSATLVEKGEDSDKLHAKLLASDAKFEVVPVSHKAVAESGTKAKCMSISDKIAQWNVVGVQGSLLSAFVEPIYIDGLVLTDDCQVEAVKRALYERIDEKAIESKLSSTAFHLNRHPVGLYKPSNNHEQLNGKLSSSTSTSCNFISHNWYNSLTNRGRRIEVLNSQQGTVYDTNRDSSRLCKLKLAKRYQQLSTGSGVQGNRKLSAALIPPNEPVPATAATAAEAGTYRALKNKSTHFNKAKAALIDLLAESGLGNWNKLANQVDLFHID